MDCTVLERYDGRVPRYTSYPTANHFHPGVDAGVYASWLETLPADARLSLYAHVPFCDSMCWFCGCHTKIVRRHGPVSAYLEVLIAEIEAVARHIGPGPTVSHVHWGGGTPTILDPAEIERLAGALREAFPFESGAEFAVEIDPRRLTEAAVGALARSGVNRVSLGVQDVNPEVQRAINRVQPIAVTRRVVEWLRAAGIDAINIDLMYGLPGQDVERVRHTVAEAVALAPERFALFGYAHVPWMKRHQRILERASLPGRDARWDQYHAAFEALTDAGYVAVGLDHFALPGDAMARALSAGTLRRNFQGYTTDAADALVGFGASAIGALEQGYVQNQPDIAAWLRAVREGVLPTHKGIEITPEDVVRRAVIERLMCDMAVDLGDVSAHFDLPAGHFDDTLGAADALASDGLVERAGRRLVVTEQARPLLRSVCALFDGRLPRESAERRHAQAV